MIELRVAEKNDYGIEIIVYETIDKYGNYCRIIGYNDILIGDSVSYNGVIYTVVIVSRLGHLGLSRNGQLPYELSVYPKHLSRTLSSNQ